MATRYWTGAAGDGLIASAGNWAGAAAPAAGDTLIFRDNAVAVRSGQDTSAATYARVIFDASYTGLVGSPASPWILAATIVEIGSYAGIGTAEHSGSINLDTTTVTSTIYVYGSASVSSLDPDRPPVYLLANEASTEIHVLAGNVAIADLPAATSSFSALFIGYLTASSGAATASLGIGATCPSINQYSGTATIRGIINNVATYGGTMTIDTTDAINTLTINGGVVYPDNHGTLTTLALSGGTADFLRTAAARTVTNTTMGRASTLRADFNRVTLTNKIDFTAQVSVTATRI